MAEIPRGIQVLLRKASKDREFRALLLERRAGAAASAGVELQRVEIAILEDVSREQLDTLIDDAKGLRPAADRPRIAAVVAFALLVCALVLFLIFRSGNGRAPRRYESPSTRKAADSDRLPGERTQPTSRPRAQAAAK